MRFSYAHVDTDKLKIEKGTKATDYSPAPEDVNAKFNNYATTASLSAYIAKTDTGALKSCIEAIADDINLTAGGSINISGNKSVNIRGNTFLWIVRVQKFLTPDIFKLSMQSLANGM